MSDVAAAEAPIEPAPPAPLATAASEAAPPQAEAPADQVAERALPEIEHAIGPLRQAVLDHLLDSVEAGPQSVSQILAALPAGTTRGSAESAIKREFDQGRIVRTSPGHYALAPVKSVEPPKVPPPPPPDEAVLFAALEAWAVDPASWDAAASGPPPDDPASQVPLDIRTRFLDRVRKREARRRDAAAALARQAEADRHLRDALIEACHGNVVLGPKLDDVSCIRSALEIVDLDTILMAIRGAVDLVLPTPPPLKEWRETRLLEAIATMYCRQLGSRLVAVWSAAKAQKAAGASEHSPGAQEPAAPENASTVPPGNGGLSPDSCRAG
jgi:hypothetical protein